METVESTKGMETMHTDETMEVIGKEGGEATVHAESAERTESAESAESTPNMQPSSPEVAECLSQEEPAESQTDTELTIQSNQEPDGQLPSEGSPEAAACAALQQVYSDFDFAQEMKDPTFRALYRGECRPTLRQVYEMCHRDTLDQELYQRGYRGAFLDRYQQCLGEIQRQAEARAEETVAARIAEQIRIRGARPAENGMSSHRAVRMHPDVAHMTREDRARLAQRAAQGDEVPLS